MRFTVFFKCGRKQTFVADGSTSKAIAIADAYASKKKLEVVSIHFGGR